MKYSFSLNSILFCFLLSTGFRASAQGCFPQDKLPSHIISLTATGERPEWSLDGRHVYFLDKAGGEVWQVDIKTKETMQLTNPADRPQGHGYYRVFCMSNGDLLLCCGAERHRLYFQVMDKSLKTLPRTILGGGWDDGGEGCDEGPAVSRTSMKIAWTTPGQLQIYTGEMSYSGGQPLIINKKLLVDHKNVITVDGIRYESSIESQNWRPEKEEELIFSQYSTVWRTVERNKPTVEFRRNSQQVNDKGTGGQLGSNKGGAEVFGININTGKIVNYSKDPDIYDEPEGIFPDGEYTLVECNRHKPSGGTGAIDLYKLRLDGSGDKKRLTFFADVEGYRASNPVVSDDGKFIVFSGSKANMDAGQGCGLYLFDIMKYEKAEKSK
jgi:Tol biopolymer transport system component